MKVTCEKVGDVSVLVPLGRHLDGSNSKAFGQNATSLAAPGSKVILDLAALQYIDSGGCGAIVNLLRHVKPGGGDLKLCCLSQPVRMVLELVRMHHLLDISNTRDEALRAYQV